MNKAEANIARIEDITVKFIEFLGESAIKSMDNIKPEVKVAFMLEVLKTLHNKD